ncbi:hypothetical protein JCGZ_01713 [Jatropha curcas]|uniref:HMA domain-containing protein n=1 Tax=Jatropha curcas TaxID=180498 RepID=A0A067JGD8_JATCU|nr:heavy metal-associated isoprenylated plant protein 46 [Jatropha curcas]KDP22991.1 hypothetical protein JCGZ_01713 [Jatropha curcas]
MKQKIVIKVSMSSQKSRSKAMKIAVGVAGVESAALRGQDKSQIEVVGDGVDAVKLTTLLRKQIGYSELVSVSAVGEKKNENIEDKKGKAKAWPYMGSEYVYAVPQYLPCHYQQYPEPSSCSIM